MFDKVGLKMISRQQIIRDINKIPDEKLMELHQVVKDLSKIKTSGKKTGLLAKLKEIKIKGPKDFANNIDEYLKDESIGR